MTPLALGVDVGSTTIKAVLVDGGGALVASSYARHLGAPLAVLARLLEELAPRSAEVTPTLTGSGARTVADAWGAPWVHEVSAVTAAATRRSPAARSILELGGQDAKLMVRAEDRVHVTMNDRCAAGTGVTIDRCLFRLGLDAPAAAQVVYDAALSRPVSSKCGVFAETDLCNLARRGLPPRDLVVSLADAFVLQTLAVLARGQTLPPDVLLLGGPLAHLPVLASAFRHRLIEEWRRRGVETAGARVTVPEHALLHAALGAVELGGRRVPDAVPRPLGHLLDRLLGAPPLPPSRLDRPFARAARADGRQPRSSARAAAGRRGPVRLGVDAGSTTCKVVALDEDGAVVAAATRMSTRPIEDARELLAEVQRQIDGHEVVSLGVTGYGAALLAPVLGADAEVLETIAHARAARAVMPDVEVVCDVGGQDIKIVVLDAAGAIRDFRVSSQCSAGIGMILEATARQLGVPLERYAELALAAARAPWFGDSCSVFLDANRLTFQRQGFSAGEILAGLARALPRVLWTQVTNGTPPSSLGRAFLLQGGVQRNRAAVAAQIDFLHHEVAGVRVAVHPRPSEAGAIGAAICGAEAARRRGGGRPAVLAPAARVTVRSDASTRCRLCASGCARSFVSIEAQGEGAGPGRLHVIGNACSEGAAPDGASSRQVRRKKRALTPNLLAEEVRLFFHPRHAGPASAIRRSVRIGIPRVLSLYRAAPLFRAYLGALGARDVVFSPITSDRLWRQGASHGANDPCFPVKVALAHVHHLIHAVHDAGTPLDAIFVPHFTHALTPVRHAIDTASCPVIAGAPDLVRAALGQEIARRGIRLIDPVITVTEPQLLSKQLFEAFGDWLGASERESRAAVRAGVAACAWVDARLEAGARVIFDRLEREPGHGAVLVVGRPYHSDPGLNHRVGEELQALGFPVITVRSIPRTSDRDRGWIERLLAPDVASGRIADPFDVRDLAPEAANSGVLERLFAARVAARSGRFGVVDLSSFKCGQDAPAYAPLRELLDRHGTPLCALHDLDETRPAISLRLRLSTFTQAMIDRGLAPWA